MNGSNLVHTGCCGAKNENLATIIPQDTASIRSFGDTSHFVLGSNYPKSVGFYSGSKLHHQSDHDSCRQVVFSLRVNGALPRSGYYRSIEHPLRARDLLSRQSHVVERLQVVTILCPLSITLQSSVMTQLRSIKVCDRVILLQLLMSP